MNVVQANALLAELERIQRWEPVDAQTAPGSCIVVGHAASGSVNITTAVGSAMPSDIAIDDTTPRRVIEFVVHSADSELPIGEPSTDASSATIDDLRYALRHLGCQQPPCDVAQLRVAYAVHRPGLDVFGYALGADTGGEASVVNGIVSEVRHTGCPTGGFTWHEHPAAGGTTWIGGSLTMVNSATLRLSYSDGSHPEYALAGRAYLVESKLDVAADAGSWRSA